MPKWQASVIPDKIIARFWGHVDRGAAGDCWLWRDHADKDGYGRFIYQVNGVRHHHPATHLALHLDGKVRPPDWPFALHSCDNPPCVNPAHLSWGTNAENMVHRSVRDRLARGERHGMTRLQENDIHRIRADSRSSPKVARDFGVSESTVQKIRRGECWQHVPWI